MRKVFLFIFMSLGLFAFTISALDDDNVVTSTKKTGIILDSMGNEVLLVFEDNHPAYYMSEIFTPVCNTGECLPVYINIYWHLNGEYMKFDQPEGEILTKLDHVPFTEADYELLDEIIKDMDPRKDQIGTSDYSEANPKEDSHTSPSVAMGDVIDKHDMVDGISGATLPEIKSQFVPGALYTTYTIWGLANDSRYKMSTYTREQLFPKYAKHLIAHEDLECRGDVIEWMASKSDQEDARVKVLINLIDSGDSLMQSAALSQMYFNYYELDEIQAVLDRTFYGESTFMIQRNIIWDWAYNFTPSTTLIKLSSNLLAYEEHFPEMMAVFENKTEYPEGVVENMTIAYPKLKADNQLIMQKFVVTQKDYFSKADWELIKTVK